MIPLPPITAWKSGSFHRMPILTGFNANEGSIFIPSHASKSQDFTDFFRLLLPSLPKADLVILNEVYPDPLLGKDGRYKENNPALGAQFMRLEQAYGDFAYVAPVLQTASFASNSSSENGSEEGPPVYLYKFALPTNETMGAYHGSHSPFITRNPEVDSMSETVREISEMMHGYWTSFILTGDPNAVKGVRERVEWPSYNEEEGKMLVFGEGNRQVVGGVEKGDVAKVVGMEELRRECGFWMERTDLFES